MMLPRLAGVLLAAGLVLGCDDTGSQATDATPNPLAAVPRDQLYDDLRQTKPDWNRWCHRYYTNPDDPGNRGDPDFCLRDMPDLIVQGLRGQGYDVTLAHVKEPWLWEFMDQRMRPIWECREAEMLKPIGQGDEAACDPWMQAHRSSPLQGN